MLRMDGFTFVQARTPEEAVALHGGDPERLYVAGGTDLLPNLKHRILRPNVVIGLGGLPRGIRRSGGTWELGAGLTLARLAAAPVPSPLARAASLIAGPQIRNMGTLGGNVLLDTRCFYYNQSAFWRRALGGCLKAEGDWCHVVGGPKTCVATQSSDTVPVLLALDARLRLLGAGGVRELPLRELFRFDGRAHLQRSPEEVLTHVIVPDPGPGFRGGYHKLRLRGAIDFPVLGLALAASFDGPGPGAALTSLILVVGAINPAPKPIRGLEPFLGRALDDDSIEAIAGLVYQQTRPQAAVAGEPGWRRHMAAVYTRRGLRALRDDPLSPRPAPEALPET